ncbi:MAG: AMP-binding protein [Planctomycetota bacterium]|nr:AMP-binding protein [Planctomycetota bacterium]
MGDWMNLGQMTRIYAARTPGKVAFKDRQRAFTFAQVNERVNRLANGLLALGLQKGDKISALLENSIEIIELYLAAAKTGIIINPINFRLSANDVQYIADHAESKVFFVHDEFMPMVETLRARLPLVKQYVKVASGEAIRAWQTSAGSSNALTPTLSQRERESHPPALSQREDYDGLLRASSPAEPDCEVSSEDIWVLLYTSGTTGVPKGVLRTHKSYIAFYFINAADFGFTDADLCLNVMPLCHVNSTFFSFTFTYVGGAIYVHPARNFEPVEILEIIQREKATFISLIPTHYNLILNAPRDVAGKYDVSSVRKLLCSSAPARKEMKKAVMEFFPGVQLYEGYGSTEAGIVTVLKPHEQFTKLGSIGRESLGTDSIKILDESGRECAPKQVGELFSKGPMMFKEYYKLPEKTLKSFRIPAACACGHVGGSSSCRPFREPLRSQEGTDAPHPNPLPEGEGTDGAITVARRYVQPASLGQEIENAWFSAGDLAMKDEDGYFWLVDRKDNMIITGGEHVYPTEVEEIIARHPAVFDVAVVGASHEKWGEAVVAVVILKEGQKCTEAEIVDFCADKMARYKKPKTVRFIKRDEMPRTPTGKILHREVRRLFAGA